MTGNVTVRKHTRRRQPPEIYQVKRREKPVILPEEQEAANLFFDDLRESGITNMYGAAPYLQREFGVDRETAREMLREWMRTFAERHPERR